MTLTVSRPSTSEWQLTVELCEDAGREATAWASASEAEVERLAGLLAHVAGYLLCLPAAEACGEQNEPPAICFL